MIQNNLVSEEIKDSFKKEDEAYERFSNHLECVIIQLERNKAFFENFNNKDKDKDID